jgi:hypothetical protein
MSLVDHPQGGYRFLPGIAPYSCGVVAQPGYEIVHVKFARPVHYRQAFDKISDYLLVHARPKAALCAIELRSPVPFTFQGFAELNQDYADILKNWGLFVDGVNPVARTNVAPELNPPADVVIFGFSYTRPCTSHSRTTFVVAGGGELPDGKLDAESIVARGDRFEEGLLTKAKFVIGLMQSRLFGLGAGWADVTATNVYTIHSMNQILGGAIHPVFGPASAHGITWYFTRPPILEIEYEMDLRGVVHEEVLN